MTTRARGIGVAVAAVVVAAGVGVGGRAVRAEAPAVSSAPAAVVTPDAFFHDLAHRVAARFDALTAAQHSPQLVPPTPVAVAWRPQKLAPSLDLGAPLLAMTAADLDGDGRAELYLVTTKEVIALAVAGNRVRELGRVAFVGEPPPHRPRDPVGAAIVARANGPSGPSGAPVVLASASTAGRTLRVSWRGKKLVGDPGAPGFALCAGEQATLAPSRDYFGDGPNASYGWRCRDDLVAADGHPLHVRAQLAVTGKLDVAVERCELSGACAHDGDFALPHVGIGFELADLDRDGRVEVVFGGAVAPGEPDELRVVALGDDERKPKWKKAFGAGGVAGIAVGDIDGKGSAAQTVIAAVRLIGATRVDLWRMN